MKTFARRGRRPLLWLVLLLCCAGGPALAETLTVTSTGDSGPGSLRQAMLDAMTSAEASTIVFAPAADGVITLDSPLPDLLASGGDLTITGNGAANTIIDGAGQRRPFKAEWQNDLHFTLRRLTVRNGFADQGQGGAIYMLGGNSSTRLTLEAVELVGNRSTYDGGAIYASISTRIEDSLFAGNNGGSFGGGIHIDGSSALLARNTTFADNVGGVIRISGSGNANDPVSRLVNVTATGDRAGDDAVLVVESGARVSLSNSLIGGGIPSIQLYSGGLIDLATSLNNVLGDVVNSGFEDGVNGNQVNVATPLIGLLGDYGGLTRTLPLLPGSPALDAGTGAGGDIPASDQRGVARAGLPDVGAFESQGFTLSVSGGDGQSTPVGTPFADPLAVAATAVDNLEPVAGGIVHFSAPGSGASAVFTAADAIIGSDGAAQAVAIANVVVGGPYAVTASLSATQSVDFFLTNTAGVCGAFAFPYTLAGTDNAARVAELRQAIECANANISEDVIDLGGHTLGIGDGPYTNTHGATALPFIISAIELRNGELERETSAPAFRLIYVDSAGTLTVRGMALRGGSASNAGGAILANGPYVESHPLTLIDSVFENNSAPSSGGAVASWQYVAIQTSRFIGNAAASGAAIYGRDLIFVTNSRFEGNGDDNTQSVLYSDRYVGIINSLFADNQLTAADSSLMHFGDTTQVVEFRNVTIAGNSVQHDLLGWRTGAVALRNCIVWDNEYASLGSVSPIHSLLPGFAGANGNLDQPPGFVGPGDYHLDAGSPAIDAGDNDYGSFDDLDLNPRPLDDAGVADIGHGTAPLIDMGAYEYQADSVAAGISVTPTSGLVTGEAGTTANFTIVLERYPAADVSLALSSSDSSEGIVAPASLTFTQADWNLPRTVTITGVDDALVDGDQAYTIVIAPAGSADPAYDGIDPPDVAVVNQDDEAATYGLGGTLVGLSGSGLALSLDGNEILPVATNGGFTFATMLAPGEDYVVAVASQPQDPPQACVVINGSGTMGTTAIDNIVVNCGASVTYAIGGTLDGLAGGGLVLQLNGSGDLALAADGDYAFVPRLVEGAGYVVTIRTQPQGQWCTLANASGTVQGADVTDIDVACAPLQAQLHLGVDDGREFARYGRVRDYFVTLGNTGNAAATGITLGAGFSAAFDVANAQWQCVGSGGGASCGSGGSGGFSDSANVPPNSSLTWIVSVPVLGGSNEPDATLTVGGSGLAGASDTDTLVIFRDGHDVPYADGTQSPGEPEPFELQGEQSLPIEWPASGEDGLGIVRVLATPGGRVVVQRLRWQGADFVRLLGTDARDRERASAWARVPAAAQLVVARVSGNGNEGIVLLEGAAAPLALPQRAGDDEGEIE